jgi:hypothetical protein
MALRPGYFMLRRDLSLTPWLQPGVRTRRGCHNRFNGLPRRRGKPLKRLGWLAACIHRAEAAVLIRWAPGTASRTAPPAVDVDEFLALDRGLRAYPQEAGSSAVTGCRHAFPGLSWRKAGRFWSPAGIICPQILPQSRNYLRHSDFVTLLWPCIRRCESHNFSAYSDW